MSPKQFDGLKAKYKFVGSADGTLSNSDFGKAHVAVQKVLQEQKNEQEMNAWHQS